MTRYREGFLRAVYSLAEDAWDEAGPDPGWTYRDTLAHVASNDLRAQTRLRALLGERDDAELAALEDVGRLEPRARSRSVAAAPCPSSSRSSTPTATTR